MVSVRGRGERRACQHGILDFSNPDAEGLCRRRPVGGDSWLVDFVVVVESPWYATWTLWILVTYVPDLPQPAGYVTSGCAPISLHCPPKIRQTLSLSTFIYVHIYILIPFTLDSLQFYRRRFYCMNRSIDVELIDDANWRRETNIKLSTPANWIVKY